MRLKTIIVAVAAAALLPTAAFADPTPAPSDKANGARTCAALKTSMGATFATTYGTNADKSNAMGKCVSAWTRAEHQNRHEAATACKAEQPDAKGAALQRCIQAKLKAERTAERAATIKAAKTCKAERSSLGAAAFTAKYGTKANAFGKCVSKLAQAQQD